MDEEFPTNAHKATKALPPVAQPAAEPEDEKKIEPVTVNEVQRRKKPLSKRFAETFFGGDAKGAMGFVMADVLIPAVKDTIADAFSQGIERILFGEARSTSRRTGFRPGGSGGYVNYQRFGSTPQARREEPRNISRRARASHDFDEIVLATRVEAETVIDRMFDLVSQYGHASVSDLYDLVGITGSYTDAKWGWTDLRGATVGRVRNGYVLELPRTEAID